MEQKKTSGSVENRESSLTKLTRQSEEQMESVFNNPLLVDKIVKHSIYTANGKQIDNETTVAIRLVNKYFLQSISRLLKKSGDWTIELDIRKVSDGTKVEKFVRVFTKSSRSVDSILPISLEIYQRHLSKGTHNKLNNLFEHCSDLISTLCVQYPVNRGSTNNLKCDNLSFPILQNFKFKFETSWASAALPPKETISESHSNCLKFLQNVLLNSQNLKHFTLKKYDDENVNMSSLILPGTLKGMKFDGPITQNILTLLTSNRLSNLTALDVDIYEESEVQLIYTILEHFQEQLTGLSMNVSDDDNDDENSPICIKLPLLIKLEKITLSGKHLKLDPKRSNVLSTVLPSLTLVVFKHLQESVFLDLIQGSRFEKVNNLKLSLFRTQSKVYLNEQMMREINGSFPQVQVLSLVFNFNETGGVEYLFQNFTLLRNLRLDFVGVHLDASIGYKMVSLFLGISMELARQIVDNTDNNANVPINNPKSIMNLKDLTSLTLHTPRRYFLGDCTNQFFGDIVSSYGLEKMSNLQEINLWGGFSMLR